MAISTYTDFTNNYLLKNGVIGNANNLNKAPDKVKQELDETILVIDALDNVVSGLTTDLNNINTKINNSNLDRADKYLATQNIANMLYNASGDLIKIRYKVDADTDYETFDYTNGELSQINHYVGGVLKGNSVLSYTGGNLSSVVYTGV